MKSTISALMDGELGAGELHEPLSALGADSEARETWRTYHLISDALRALHQQLVAVALRHRRHPPPPGLRGRPGCYAYVPQTLTL